MNRSLLTLSAAFVLLQPIASSMPAFSEELRIKAPEGLGPRTRPGVADPAFREPLSKPVPHVIYQRAWRLVRENFYRQDFNNQDFIRWKFRYDGKLKTLDDAHKAINTMLSSLNDPYTRLIVSTDDYDKFGNPEESIVGVGLQLGMNKELKTMVLGLIDGGPASKLGIKGGWEITAINGKPIKGLSLEEIVKQIRGPVNTSVEMTFFDGKAKTTRKITRETIPIRSVALVKKLPGDIGYIRMDNTFNCVEEMRTALTNLSDSNALILDLRNNPGDGQLTDCVDLANMFLQRGVILSTVDADGYKNSTFSKNTPIYRKPVVVLINRGTRHMAEILAATLQQNSVGATLVGERTFGMGLITAKNRLDDGSIMMITIAQVLTPKDQIINRRGVSPDKEVKLGKSDWEAGKGPWWIDLSFSGKAKPEPDEKDTQFAAALEVLSKREPSTNSKN